MTAVLWATRRDGDRLAALDAWLLSAVAMSCGIGLNAFQQVLPDWSTLVLGNSLMVAAVLFIWHGARLLRGVSSRIWFVALGIAAVVANNIYFVYVEPSLRSRVVSYSAMMLIACLVASYEFWRQRVPHLRFASRFAAVPFFLMGLMMLVRAIATLSRSESTTVLAPTAVNIATYLVGSATLLAVFASMVMAVNAVRAAQVRELAYRDSLTGALSRRGFYAMLHEWTQHNVQGATVAVLDVNGLKQINDSLGHEVGDQALKVLVDTCRQCLPTNALIARFGGDEFVLLLAASSRAASQPASTGADELLHRVADNFQRTAQALLPKGSALSTSVAFGRAAVMHAEENAIAEALRNADSRMYSNKVRQRER